MELNYIPFLWPSISLFLYCNGLWSGINPGLNGNRLHFNPSTKFYRNIINIKCETEANRLNIKREPQKTD